MTTSGVPLLLAIEGAPAEQAVLAALSAPSSGVQVIRRCVDLADLLAAATAGTARVAVVAAGLRRLDHEAVDRLSRSGLLVVGLVPPDDEAAERRLLMLGISEVVAVDVEDPHRACAALLGVLRDGSRTTAVVSPGPAADVLEPVSEGRLVAVWGPTGAPGRSTVATYLACETAVLGVPTLLADADTYGGSVAQLLGLLDESPGLAAATRAVNTGSLDLEVLAGVAREVTPGLRVLTGIVRADRWPELRPAALAEVWTRARFLAAITVVDCGFGLEQDEELSYDTLAPRRNGATLTTLEEADVLLAVGRADPVGIQRLVRTLPEVRTAAPKATVRVVLTRVRKGPVGPDFEAQLRDTLARHAGVDDAVLIPEDQSGYDAALAGGRALHEVAPRSPARAALMALARELVGPQPSAGRRRGGRRSHAT